MRSGFYFLVLQHVHVGETVRLGDGVWTKKQMLVTPGPLISSLPRAPARRPALDYDWPSSRVTWGTRRHPC